MVLARRGIEEFDQLDDAGLGSAVARRGQRLIEADRSIALEAVVLGQEASDFRRAVLALLGLGADLLEDHPAAGDGPDQPEVSHRPAEGRGEPPGELGLDRRDDRRFNFCVAEFVFDFAESGIVADAALGDERDHRDRRAHIGVADFPEDIHGDFHQRRLVLVHLDEDRPLRGDVVEVGEGVFEFDLFAHGVVAAEADGERLEAGVGRFLPAENIANSAGTRWGEHFFEAVTGGGFRPELLVVPFGREQHFPDRFVGGGDDFNVGAGRHGEDRLLARQADFLIGEQLLATAERGLLRALRRRVVQVRRLVLVAAEVDEHRRRDQFDEARRRAVVFAADHERDAVLFDAVDFAGVLAVRFAGEVGNPRRAGTGEGQDHLLRQHEFPQRPRHPRVFGEFIQLLEGRPDRLVFGREGALDVVDAGPREIDSGRLAERVGEGQIRKIDRGDAELRAAEIGHGERAPAFDAARVGDDPLVGAGADARGAGIFPLAEFARFREADEFDVRAPRPRGVLHQQIALGPDRANIGEFVAPADGRERLGAEGMNAEGRPGEEDQKQACQDQLHPESLPAEDAEDVDLPDAFVGFVDGLLDHLARVTLPFGFVDVGQFDGGDQSIPQQLRVALLEHQRQRCVREVFLDEPDQPQRNVRAEDRQHEGDERQPEAPVRVERVVDAGRFEDAVIEGDPAEEPDDEEEPREEEDVERNEDSDEAAQADQRIRNLRIQVRIAGLDRRERGHSEFTNGVCENHGVGPESSEP